MYVAFSMERVSIVAPLINSYTVFVSLLTPLMARQIETVTGANSPAPHWWWRGFSRCRWGRTRGRSKIDGIENSKIRPKKLQVRLG